ncbi:MAG: hypothetical protein A2Y66_00840, partial [Nitrospirae bacterium RBG_13_41_22]
TPIKMAFPLSVTSAILLFTAAPYLAGIFAKDAATQAGLITIFQVFSFTLPFSACYVLLLAATRGLKRMDYNVYIDNIFYSVVLLSSTVLFSVIGFGIIGLAWSYALTVMAAFVSIFYFFNKRIFSIFGKMQSISENRVLLSYTMPLFIGSLATIVIGSFDTIFVGIFRTTADTGIYNAALPTAKFIFIFGSAFIALFLPIMVEYKAKNMIKETRILYITTTKWIFFCGLPFTLLLMFFSKSVLNILFGAEYLPAGGALSILSLAFFIQSIFLTSNIMLSIEKTKYVMSSVIVAAVLNLILNVALIPSFGILGAAIATSSSTILFVSLGCFFAWKFTGMNPFDFKSILKASLAGLLSLAFIMFIYRFGGLSSSLFIVLPLFFVFILIYIILLFAFRTLDKNDISVLLEIERKSGIRIGFIRKILKKLVR